MAFGDWVVTYKEYGYIDSVIVNASCIIEAIVRSGIKQSEITGCVIYVSQLEVLGIDLAHGRDYNICGEKLGIHQ